MPAPIKKLADRFLTNPKTIQVARPATTNTNITQWVVPVKGQSFEKRKTVRQLLRGPDVRTAIIFCNRKTTVRELNKSLKEHGFASGEIHGDMDQPARIAELERFKRGDVNILVASDVAARGLDIKGVSHVVNFDAPWHPDDYVHRIGRTGRAGATGVAYTFVGPDDAENIQNIEKLTGEKIRTLDPLPAEPEQERPTREPRRERRAERTPRTDRVPEAQRESVAQVAPVADRVAPARNAELVNAGSNDERERHAAWSDRSRGDQRRRRDRHDRDDGPDDGWNGPIPDFLKVTLTT